MKPLPLLCLLLILSGCAAPRVAHPVFRADKLAAMDAAITTAIAEHKCPGGVLWLEHDGAAYHKAYGHRALVPERERMTEDTVFDLASLTKVVATTPAVMLLEERGQVKLDAPVAAYIPEFTGDGRERVTVRELLTHTSGLPPDLETKTDWHGWNTAIQMACATQLASPPGTVYRYSDINFILLGEIVRRVSHQPLQDFVQREIYGPLKMKDTGYLPLENKRIKPSRIAPTEVVNGRPWRGIVHDPTARHMGGVAGHAGLFSTASDLARFARMMLNLGELDGVRIFQQETVRQMTSPQAPAAAGVLHGLGWDIDSPYAGPRGSIFPVGSYGHTGWTGTSLWIDPFSKTFVIFLSNRNHPTEAGNVIALRRTLGTLAAEAVGLEMKTNPPQNRRGISATRNLRAAGDGFSAFVGLDDFSGFTRSKNENGETVLLSPVVTSPINWNQLVVSWNAAAPPGTHLAVDAKAIQPGHATKFYSLGFWSPDENVSHSAGGQKDSDGRVATDTLILSRPAQAAQIRLTLGGANDELPALKFLGLSFCNSAFKPAARPPNRAAWGKVIATPERSQEAYPQENGWCSATSMAMVLERWAGVLHQPEMNLDVPEVAAGVLDTNWGTGNWPFNTAFAGRFENMRAYVTRFSDLSEVEDWVAAGIPVILSAPWHLLKPGRHDTGAGHLVVCIGFTKSGDVVINDPATNLKKESVRHIYRRRDVIRAWAASHNTVYLVYPLSAKIPANVRGQWASQ